MIRILFVVLVLVHGLIHLIGFTSGWKLSSSSILTGKTLLPLTESGSRIAGLIWLLASLLWISTAILYLLRKDSFVITAIIVLVISQGLIIFFWQEAKFGTIPNLILAVVIIFNVARLNFIGAVDEELSEMINGGQHTTNLAAGRTDLPCVVQEWLVASKSTGAVPSVVHLVQEGSMRSSPASDWMSFTANQNFTIDPPGFVWDSRINAAPMVTIAGRDKFENGHGNMLIKPLYIYTLANTSGPEVDQGTMLRYMAELIWFPEAAVMDYLQWEQVDSTSAVVTMKYEDVEAKGLFKFDEKGLVTSFIADRFGDFNGEFRKEKWEVRIIEHSSINGHIIGTKCEVTWKLTEGDFTWLRLEVKDISYKDAQ